MMRAKMKVTSVKKHDNIEQVDITLSAVSKDDGYPDDGSDEDNTFAKFTPMAECSMSIQNPDLLDKFTVGDAFYIDFTKI